MRLERSVAGRVLLSALAAVGFLACLGCGSTEVGGGAPTGKRGEGAQLLWTSGALPGSGVLEGSLSHDGMKLVVSLCERTWQDGDMERQTLWLVAPDSVHRITGGPMDRHPDWLRGRSKVAFTRTRAGPAGSLTSAVYIVNLESLDERAFDLPIGIYGPPRWSLEGQRLASCAGFLDDASPAVMVLELANETVTWAPVGELVCGAAPPAWSEHGDRILIPGSYRGIENQIWLARPDTGTAREVCSTPGEMLLTGVAFGPDTGDVSFSVAFPLWSNAGATQETAAPYRLPLDRHKLTRVATLTAEAGWLIGVPLISADGKGIATASNKERQPQEPCRAAILWSYAGVQGRIPIREGYGAGVVAWSRSSELLAVSYEGEDEARVAIYRLPIRTHAE